MSYILDALKKAERERKLVKVPTIETVHELPERRRTHPRLIGIVTVAVLCLGLAIFFLVQRTDFEKQVLETSVSTTTEDSTGNLERAAVLSAEAPVSVPTQIQGKPTAPAGGISSKPEATEIVAMAPKSSEQVTDAPSSPVTVPVPLQSINTMPDFAPPPLRSPAPAAVSAVPLRDIATAMVLSIHLYSDNKDERTVFINGRKYLEGDSVTTDCVVENITPEGVVLQRGDERVTLRPGAPPVFH